MEIVVLVKVVADRESIAAEPDGTTARPEGTSFVNPYDQRAVRVALDLRHPGERVTLVSMGGAATANVLAPYREAGVDRIVLLSDDRLRGSDLLGTARALATVVRSIGPAIVLTGERATDSETGALVAEISPLLWSPAVTRARSVVRAEDGLDLEVSADADGGTARYRVRAPCLISVGEKITKPLKVAAGRPADPGAVEVVALDSIGLSPSGVGHCGARTRVVATRSVARERGGHLFDAAHLVDGVRAIASIRPRAPPFPEATLAPLPVGLPVDRELLVLVSDDSGALDPKALSVLTGVRRMLPDHWPSAVWVGPTPSVTELARLAAAGAARGYGLHMPGPDVLPIHAALGLERALDRRSAAAAVIVTDHGFGLETVGRLANRRNIGLVTGAESVGVGPSGRLAWTKPSWGARELATVETDGPVGAASVRPRFAPREPPPGATGGLDWIHLPFEVPAVAVHRLDRVREPREEEYGDLDRAEWVVGVGTGIGGPEAIRALARAIHPLGGAVAGTRRVVDAGWLPIDRQVGLTGRTLAPCLAILVGVSGSPNQMIGWRRAETIAAINPEPTAPVFRGVDIGLVARHEEALGPLLRTMGATG